MAIATQARARTPHPVAFDVFYPERLSRLKVIFKLFLAIPHFIVLLGARG